MTDLTEQWKKGELPEGKYWVKYKHWTDTVEMLDYSVGLFLDVDVPIEDDRIEKVIAEVPDYVEWQNMVNCACEEHEANHRLLEENAQLQEKIERLEKQLNKQGEQVLTMIDLLLKSYFYLSAAMDCKLTLEHCGNIGILCDLINKCFKDLGK